MSLYIKDRRTADLAADLARQLKVTKTEAVRDALERRRHELNDRAPGQNLVEWLREYRQRNPLPPLTGLKADKAFYDSLYEDDDD